MHSIGKGRKAKPKDDAIFTLPKADQDRKFRLVLYPLLFVAVVFSFWVSEEFGEPEEVAQLEEVAQPSLESLIGGCQASEGRATNLSKRYIAGRPF